MPARAQPSTSCSSDHAFTVIELIARSARSFDRSRITLCSHWPSHRGRPWRICALSHPNSGLPEFGHLESWPKSDESALRLRERATRWFREDGGVRGCVCEFLRSDPLTHRGTLRHRRALSPTRTRACPSSAPKSGRSRVNPTPAGRGQIRRARAGGTIRPAIITPPRRASPSPRACARRRARDRQEARRRQRGETARRDARSSARSPGRRPW